VHVLVVFYFTPNLQLLSESRQFLEVGPSPVNVADVSRIAKYGNLLNKRL